MRGLWRAPFRGSRVTPALALVGLLLIGACLSPLLPSGSVVDPAATSQWPSPGHPLGTDHLGRDVALRAVHATRSFVGPGLFAVALALCLGVPLGAAAGWDRSVLRRPARTVSDALASVPGVVLVLLLASTWGAGPVAWAVGAGIAAAPGIAELVRERLERLVVRSHVDAARAHGFSERHVLWIHGVWLGAARGLARRSIELLGVFAALECTLSYLGSLGVAEPTPSWGNMIAFEWGHPVGPATLVPASLLWLTASLTARAGRAFAEVPG